MHPGQLRILIAGAGIAGLATARALARAGFAADVVERSEDREEVGAGMYLPANAGRALAELGVGAAVAERSARIERQRFADHRGRTLFEVELGTVWSGVGRCQALHRAALHDLLADGVPVRAGVGVRDLAGGRPGDRTTVEFTDRSRGEYDLVIGADGVHSTVRRLVFGAAGDAGVRPVGQRGWRFVIGEQPASSTWSVLLGRGTAFLTIPIGAGRVYCYADVAAHGDELKPAAEAMPGEPVAELRRIFGGFAPPVPAILSELDDDHPVHVAIIEEVGLDSWSRGGVVLVGDAAHATSPNMAQGAAMALEDALVLAEVLATEPTVAAATAAFERRRRPRTSWVADQTHRRDHARNLPPAVRDVTLRLFGRRMFRANYAPLTAAP